jgi:hypothetical protein
MLVVGSALQLHVENVVRARNLVCYKWKTVVV